MFLGREERREQPTTGQWPGNNSNNPSEPATAHPSR
jgi:hypothetical protein